MQCSIEHHARSSLLKLMKRINVHLKVNMTNELNGSRFGAQQNDFLNLVSILQYKNFPSGEDVSDTFNMKTMQEYNSMTCIHITRWTCPLYLKLICTTARVIFILLLC